MKEKFLPIGTVVMLNGGTKRLMITGFCAVTSEKEGMFDYVGCLYPEGMISSTQTALFNHDQIKEIYALGYSDDEEKNFKVTLINALNKSNNNNNNNNEIIDDIN